MNTNSVKTASNENQTSAVNGWPMLCCQSAIDAWRGCWIASLIVHAAEPVMLRRSGSWLPHLLAVLAIILFCGHFPCNRTRRGLAEF